MVKPTPLSAADVTMTGAVPVEVKITGCVDGVFIVVLPNGTLLGLMVNVGVAAFSCSAKLLELPAPLAVMVATCADRTDDTFAVNTALVAFAGTTTAAGTITAALLLARLRLMPPLPAAVVNVTTQAELPVPVMDALLQESAANEAEEVPVWTGSVMLAGTFCSAFGLTTPTVTLVVPGGMLMVPWSSAKEMKTVETLTPADCNCEVETKPEPCMTIE
jgi:hypothetical protein